MAHKKSVKVKICGISHAEDIPLIAKAKPDYMGFVVNYPSSPRSNTVESMESKVRGLEISTVFLFVNASLEEVVALAKRYKPFAIQLHGKESAAYVKELHFVLGDIPVQIWKAVHLPPLLSSGGEESLQEYLAQMEEYIKAGCDLFVLDSTVAGQAGGTGVTCDWGFAANVIREVKVPVILAGGLTPENVAEAIKKAKPYGVDVSSGVEKQKTYKEKEMVESFIRAARKISE